MTCISDDSYLDRLQICCCNCWHQPIFTILAGKPEKLLLLLPKSNLTKKGGEGGGGEWFDWCQKHNEAGSSGSWDRAFVNLPGEAFGIDGFFLGLKNPKAQKGNWVEHGAFVNLSGEAFQFDGLSSSSSSSSSSFFRFSGRKGKNWLVPAVAAADLQSI